MPMSTFEYAQAWVADSKTFRETICGLSTPAAARQRVYREEVLEAADEHESEQHTPDRVPLIQRPFCIALFGEDSRRRVGTATWSSDGTMLLVFEVTVPAEYLVDWQAGGDAIRATFAARKKWGEDLLQDLRSDLMASSGRSAGDGTPFLNAHVIDRYLSPADPEMEEPQDFIGFALEVSYR